MICDVSVESNILNSSLNPVLITWDREFNEEHFLLGCKEKENVRWPYFNHMPPHPQSDQYPSSSFTISSPTMGKVLYFSPMVVPFTSALGPIPSYSQEPSSISFSISSHFNFSIPSYSFHLIFKYSRLSLTLNRTRTIFTFIPQNYFELMPTSIL